jgi:hypothetical protein
LGWEFGDQGERAVSNRSEVCENEGVHNKGSGLGSGESGSTGEKEKIFSVYWRGILLIEEQDKAL